MIVTADQVGEWYGGGTCHVGKNYPIHLMSGRKNWSFSCAG